MIPESSRLEFLEKFLANNFALSDAEVMLSQMQSTSWSLNRGGIADIPLSTTLSAICQKSWEPRFWEVMNSFVLFAYASLAASGTLLQQLRACQNFSLDLEDILSWYKFIHASPKFKYLLEVIRSQWVFEWSGIWFSFGWRFAHSSVLLPA